jgi:hypothetical protein
MKRNWFQNNLLIKLSIAYLLLPFVIFCLTFLKIGVGLPIVIVLSWIMWRIWKQNDSSSNGFLISKRDLLIGLVVLGLWVLLSGIGGLAFQNRDFEIRNAIFMDLIHFNWPVYYPNSGNLAGDSFALIYYIGFWLPAALIGKLFGLQIANIFIFLWTLLGVFLVAVMVKERIKFSLLGAAIIMIIFSGMDILGTLCFQVASLISYPTIWPPITIIELWVSEFFEFSSITTQLFWVFNQAIPAWICIALTLNKSNRKYVWFIWALCFFYSPIPSIGLLPFVFLIIPNQAIDVNNLYFRLNKSKVVTFIIKFLSDVKDMINIENIFGGGLILIISYLYFSANPMAVTLHFIDMNL